MSLKGRRQLVSPELPFLLGANPDRPAPAHVLNGFLFAAFGEGSFANEARELTRGDGIERPPALAPYLRTDGTAFAQFRTALGGLLNPDRRIFPTRGSPFPLTGAVVSYDPSDEGYGGALWRLASKLQIDLKERLLVEFFPKPPTDGATALLLALTNSAEPGPEPKRSTNDQANWTAQSGKLGKAFGQSIVNLVSGRIGHGSRTRAQRIHALSRATFLATFLAAVRLPELIVKAPNDWLATSPMFVFGGLPPGDLKSAGVRLACRSFERVVLTHSSSVAQIIRETLEAARIPRKLPERQRAKMAIRLAYESVSERERQEAEKAVGQTNSFELMASRLLNEVYPAGYLSRGFRNMGKKVGFAGPDRGVGAPRFLLETPILALLVEATIEEGKTATYEDWIDTVFERFGLVLGRGRRHDLFGYLSGLDTSGQVRMALDSNHEALRRRLVRSGLAAEYSDSETEVQRLLS